MTQFSVHPDPRNAGYLLNVQTDVLDRLSTRQVIPLRLAGSVPGSLPRLNPVFEIEGQPCVLLTHYQGSIETRHLKSAIDNLGAHRSEIVAALDFMLQGY